MSKIRRLMRCGCLPLFTVSGKAVCLEHDCEKLTKKVVDITGRKAKCQSCSKICDSDFDLPFFSYQKDFDFDTYYCGCIGWR